MDDLWRAVKSSLKTRIQAHSYSMWIEPITCGGVQDDQLILYCPNAFFRKRVWDHYKAVLEAEVARVGGAHCSLCLKIQPKSSKEEQQGTRAASPQQLPLPNISLRPHGGRVLRDDFTFDEFVVGGNNNFAYSAALSLAAQKCAHQNALFLLSPTGMGKSHLSQAIGHHILTEFPRERVYYMTAEDFTNEMVTSFKTNSIGSFKEKYRSKCDVLLLEDVHYLSGKARTQQELSDTFDLLFDANKKIIFSSCYAPAEIPKLNDGLRSRLSGGLISSIDKPGFRTRMRILKRKSSRMGCRIPEPVLEFLASELVRDVRQLESGLIGISARASLLKTPINLSLARDVTESLIQHQESITVDGIKKLVSKYYKISVKEMVSRSRKQAIVRPRQIAIYLARKYTDQSVQAIGRSFNRYHATALHAIGSVEKGLKSSCQIQKQVEYLCRKIESTHG
ncbi:MAG: chromosomal replication initiator protein DnaA [Desulfosarcinaceae bacterium]|nr:chromosomal replication initiator protein DnaA [Desulfosarcinaceae bacterium]